jgi:diadenosine tetraphosphate (Ap4A) HIT family hydrolase
MECIACDLTAGRRPLPGGVLHRGESWVVEHCVGPLGVGTLIVKPTRHVTGIDALTDGEADELGPLLRTTARVVRALTDAEQIYTCLWSHAGGVPGHLHYVIQPVTRAQIDELGTYGPGLQMAMFTRGEGPDPDGVVAFADRARERFAATSSAPLHPDSVPPLAAEDHVCPDCPMDFATTGPDDVRAIVTRVPGEARALLAAHPDDAWRTSGPDGSWSAAEYLCHVRDVYAVFTIRLHRARTEDDPPLEPMLNDLRARRFGYAQAALGPVVEQLDAHVAGFLAELGRVPDEGWDRPAHRYPGERRTALWLARQAAHEGRHHLSDIVVRLHDRR